MVNYKAQYGLFILVPLVISMLFLSIITGNSQGDDLNLNQSEPGVIGSPQIWLKLRIDGLDVVGDSTIASMGREGNILLWSFRHDMVVPREAASGAITGRLQHAPIIITKQIDKSTISLFKALLYNQIINEGQFRFFRPAAGSSGAEEHYYTVMIEDGYVSSIRTFTFIDYSTHEVMNMEEITFVYTKITWTYELGGATVQDTWGGEE